MAVKRVRGGICTSTAGGLFLFVWMASAAAQDPPGLTELTAPATRLPDGCGLSARPAMGLRVESNPWIGSERSVVAAIRERVDPPSYHLLDAPPLTAREIARMRLQLANGIDEAYAAAYTQATSAVIHVYGVRFTDSADAGRTPLDARRPENPRMLRFRVGSILAVVHGDGGDCTGAIGAYLQSLLRGRP